MNLQYFGNQTAVDIFQERHKHTLNVHHCICFLQLSFRSAVVFLLIVRNSCREFLVNQDRLNKLLSDVENPCKGTYLRLIHYIRHTTSFHLIVSHYVWYRLCGSLFLSA